MPDTIWLHDDVGNTQEAKKELVSLCDFEDSPSVFITPKPTRLVKRILEIAADKDSLILDSFAGSGTTGQAVLAQNKADGGNRRFILVEIDESISRTVTAQRLTRVIEGAGVGWDKRRQSHQRQVKRWTGKKKAVGLARCPTLRLCATLQASVRASAIAVWAEPFWTPTGT